MKEVTFRIPDQRFDFFMELSKELGFEAFQAPLIPNSHQELVRARIKSGEPAQMDLWQEARKQLTFNG